MMSHDEQNQVNRRDFVTVATAAVAAAGLAGMGMLGAGGSQAAAQTTQPSSTPVDAGLKSAFTKDGPTMTHARGRHGFIVMRADKKLYALSSRCTHHGCTVKDQTGQFHCPCHNSDFNYDGTVIDGPAQNGGSLPRFGISVNSDGHVMVDTSKQFYDGQWNDPAAFVALDS